MTVDYADPTTAEMDDGTDPFDAADAKVREAQKREEQIQKIASLGERLNAEYQTRCNARRENIEPRWIEDLRLYNGEYDPEVLAAIKANEGSQVFLSIGRTKTDAVEAHHSNLLLPTDDRNWEINPTPVPEMAELDGSDHVIHTTEQGADVTAAGFVDALRQTIESACDRMRDTIDDQLVECDYPQAVRKTLHQGCVIGTGVMRGPILKNKKRKRWSLAHGSDKNNPVWVKNATADTRPAIENVNAWDFYPSPGIGDITQSDGEFVRHWVTMQQLRELQFDVGFFEDVIEQVIRENPNAPKIDNQQLIELRMLSGETNVQQSGFEMIEYVGMVSASDLLACGLQVPDEALDGYKASIFMIGGKPVKAALELMEECVEKEFYVWQLAKDDTTIWGKGVPRLMRTSVLLANATIRMMIDNAGLSVGGQLIYDPTEIAPADGNPRMTPRKTWLKTGDKTIAQVFEIMEIPSQLEWLEPLFNLAVRLCDDESALPMIAQGDQAAHVTKTKGGMSMLMDAAGVMLRRSVRGFDDNVTMRVIDAMYAWNMLYNPDPTIKGDFSTKARGSSALLEREAQMEAFMQWMQFLEHNPLFKAAADWPAILEEGTRLLRVNRNSLLLPVAKIKAIVEQMKNNPPQPPELPQVTAAKIGAQASVERAHISAQALIQAAMAKSKTDADKINATLDTFAQQTQIDRAKLDAMLGLKNKELDQQAQIFNGEAALRIHTGEGVGI